MHGACGRLRQAKREAFPDKLMNDIEPGVPYLEYYPKPGGPLKRAGLAPLPFTIGRSDGVHLRIDSTQVSREHARILKHQGELRIKDLGSTNGTFVNGERVTRCMLQNKDVISLGGMELSLVLQSQA